MNRIINFNLEFAIFNQKAYKPNMTTDIIMFATDNLKIYTDLSIKGWKKYAANYGYNFFHYKEPYYDNLHIAWSKINSVKVHINQSNADTIVLVDADTIPTSLDVSIESLLDEFMYDHIEILFQKDGSHKLKYFYFPHNFSAAWKLKKRTMPNAGFIVMKNSEKVKAFFAEWIDRAQTSPLATIPPRNQNVLNFEMLNQDELNKMVGYLETWVVSRNGGKLCRHFSSMRPNKVYNKMLPYYKKLMEK
ncbi:glycosyltransferase family 77 protein [bacterium]|nr:glycosyltransferase family 77 protein [bacterium]